MLNWIVWNRTIFIKMDLALNNLQRLICHKTQITNQSLIYTQLNGSKYYNSVKHQSFVYTQLNNQMSVSNNSIQHKSFVCSQFKCQTSIWPIDRALSGTTTMEQSGPGSDGNKGGTLYSPKLQNWSLTIRLFSVIFKILIGGGDLNPLQRCSQCIQQPCPHRLGCLIVCVYRD